ncbi:hypothetical protein OIY81_2239 [Cryptosporidium canis]|nr:hypothetical protein OIY81_2239 [Cryptosporidium canis]
MFGLFFKLGVGWRRGFELTGIRQPNMGSHIMILPGRPYHGIKMSTSRKELTTISRIRRVNSKWSRWFLRKSLLDTLSSRLLPGSLVFVNSELYDSEHRRFKSFSQGGEDFVAFEVTAKLKNVSYSRQIESRDILLNIGRLADEK